MATNKIIYNNQTLIDLTNDTVEQTDVISGKTFHDKSGAALTGSLQSATLSPSDSNPATITSNTLYLANGSGVAVQNVNTVIPNDYTPPQISSGTIIKPSANGYLYKSLYSETETILWTNEKPTSNFSAQDVTLSNDYTNYNKIRFYYRNSTSDDTENYIEYKKEQIDAWIDKSITSTGVNKIGSITFMYGAYSYTRIIRGGANGATDSFYITIAYRLNTQASTSAYGVPTKITGINLDNCTNITPSSSATALTTNNYYRFLTSGYVYSGQVELKKTTLYTNSSLTTAVTTGTLTLSQDIDNFDYIEITVVVGTGSTSSECCSGLIPVSDFKTNVSDGVGRYIAVNYTNETYRYDRMFYYKSDTSVGYTTCHRHNASGSSAQSAYMIPHYVYGYKLSV